MSFLEKAWTKKAGWLILLWPVSLLFQLLIALRRKIQRRSSRPATHSVPVVVIGNISVGGTGKTPLLMALAQQLGKQGYSVGIISRGYGGTAPHYPMAVTTDTAVSECGDEALLIAKKTGCPLVIDPDRESALQALLSTEAVDVVLSDDGLQHYRLYRDLEIAVVDGLRLFDNGLCLPAGPLREPVSRLQQADFVVVNGAAGSLPDELATAYNMTLNPRFLINLVSGEKRPFGGAPFNMGNRVQAVSAIGNPERFYTLLDKLPYPLQKFSFPDHHLFTETDFEAAGLDPLQPVVMTEKDAVKCRQFAAANHWYLAVDVELQEQFLQDFSERLKALEM